ncbi:MAG: sn-glycerol-3-phosphate ABC transporter ATP-binding protein UgpC [Thermoanaerobaculia bacterium]
MAQVQFEHVAKRYDGVPVIEDLNLEIRDHEFMVLVGPSGCGKSTALRMIAGLEDITEGTIAIGGRPVNDLPPKDRDIAMVFQNYALYPHMTVRENLEFGMRIRKVPPAQIDALVREAASILEIGHLLDRKPRQLSGGQRQRVALGRAIVRKPSVYLFDEPLSNLDAKLRVQMRGEIKKLQQRLQTTTVYVTHDQVEAMTMGSRISVMKDGRIQQVGTPLEIYDRPNNLFVANFIGAPPMNFVAATVRDGGATLAASKFVLPVPDALRAATAGRDGANVVVGIRPEHIGDPSEPARGQTAKLPAEIEIVEPLGDEVIVHARVGDDLLVYKVEPSAAPEPGQKREIAVELDRLHLFDAATEARLSR